MAYERYGRDDGQGADDGWNRDDYRSPDYRAAQTPGGYARGQRGDGRAGERPRDYGARSDRPTTYAQRDYGYRRDGNDERFGQGGFGERQGLAGGSDYYRGDGDREDRGRDIYRQSRGTFDRQPQAYDRSNERGFFERAGDEVRSWFGDEEAERRREQDARADDHYRSWRDQQVAGFDRDYDEYRQENRSKFHSEFSSFRSERQGQRDLLAQVAAHQDVVGSDGAHVGTVDKVRGDDIILTKGDADAGGRHHAIPSRWLQSLDGGRVTLRKTADEAKQHWRDAERQGALFGDDQGRHTDTGEPTGRTNLNRSFSGTY